ncbi:MAG: 2-oxoacid:acceptor oxidoreductase family protein [Chloroflexi bacterium]|nr:2-oxoacid:acceptor oxidoreductase family protein [Chloroflexota bacterium]
MTNLVIVGVGGQRVITLGNLIARCALEAGLTVRGHAQSSLAVLGGSVTYHLRLGPSYSPFVPHGQADVILALELAETLRAVPYIKDGGLALVSEDKKAPMNLILSHAHYPTPEEVAQIYRHLGARFILLPKENQKTQKGRALPEAWRLLGVMSAVTSFWSRKKIEETIAAYRPREASLNLAAFRRGYQLAQEIEAKAAASSPIEKAASAGK